MSTTTTIGLSEFVIQTKNKSGIVDPRELTEEVFKNTPSGMLQEFYRTALGAYVNMRVAAERGNVQKAASNPTANSGKSRKVAAIRNWWADFCSQSLLTESGWKPMGSVTVADLTFVASERRVQASELEASAVQYDELAKAMTSNNAKTVAELSEAVVRPIFA